MINTVITGITDAIYEEFGDGYEIYTEASMQDMVEPAFFVQCLAPGIEKQNGERRKLNLLIQIQYFAESSAPKKEINDIFWRLSACLELIAVEGKKVRGTVECINISDGIMTVTAEYLIFLNRRQTDAYMDGYEWKGEVDDGDRNKIIQ